MTEASIEAIAQSLQLSEYVQRQSHHLCKVLTEKLWSHSWEYLDYQQYLHPLLVLPLMEFSAQIRHFRHQQLIRLLLCEKARLMTTEEILGAWSEIADALIEVTLLYCCQLVSMTHGMPSNDSTLLPLALGKLGGKELNFSSDIDLIFAYSVPGNTIGSVSITHEKYFIKVIQQFLRLFQDNTADGFVFRVDLRLRPFGSSGALVMPLTAMETYYQEQGRDWERYALVKARFIGDFKENPFARLLTPFVYRRYVDYSVIESLRHMKAMIHQELKLNPALNDIKRGLGGIREIEFIVQSFQLIRGGKLIQLQTTNTLLALKKLQQEGLLSYVNILRKAYLFYRKLENAIQTFADQQTHQLPQQKTGQHYILWVMEIQTYDELLRQLNQYQRIVSRIFNRVLQFRKNQEQEEKFLSYQLKQLWQGHIETSMAITVLASLGIENSERCYAIIQAFRHSPKCRRLTQAARLRLDQFMIQLLHALIHLKQVEPILLSFIRLLENIMTRSPYLALLTENQVAIPKLCYWFKTSDFITTLVINYPFLLDILIFQESWQPLSLIRLQKELTERLKIAPDSESQEDVLREFKLTYWLMIACAELNGYCKAVDAARYLSYVAEVIVQAVVQLACQQLQEKYIHIESVASHFTMIAYGKLGSREMDYNSDLDLVFLHEVSFNDEPLMIRLTQKILHMLTTRSRLGILYSTDTRLKPSGSAGLLVSHIKAFVTYQCEQAWTWEHQALMKARVIYGSKLSRVQFIQLKQTVFSRVRDRLQLMHDIQNMRLKMIQYIANPGLKHDAGGLVDLEFLIQYLVLSHPQNLWSRVTHPLIQLYHLYQQQIIFQDQFQLLKRAYFSFHQMLHQQFLQPAMNSLLPEVYQSIQELLSHFYQD